MSALYPETFKEICESVLEETDGRAVQMDSVSLARDTAGDLYLTEPTHRNVVSWVAGMYRRIQLLISLLDFPSKARQVYHSRGEQIHV